MKATQDYTSSTIIFWAIRSKIYTTPIYVNVQLNMQFPAFVVEIEHPQILCDTCGR